jgi:hypothetical protein
MLKENLTDVGPKRIRRMDAGGIDLQVLSHVQPGVQTLDRDIAVRLSREINDWLGEVVAAYPARFAGFAMLPTQAPDEAANELERSVLQLDSKAHLSTVTRMGAIWTIRHSRQFSSAPRRWACRSTPSDRSSAGGREFLL